MSVDEQLGKLNAEIEELKNLLPAASELEGIAIRNQIAATRNERAALINSKNKEPGKLY